MSQLIQSSSTAEEAHVDAITAESETTTDKVDILACQVLPFYIRMYTRRQAFIKA